MPAAARIGDQHACARHIGGKIVTGCPTVLIGERPAARVTDIAECVAPDQDPIQNGSATVIIGCQRAARVSDPTDGGHVTTGDPTVEIGPGPNPADIKRSIRKARRQKRGAP